MKTLKLKNKNGFTIIEVVLVLAIAGLIFLAVFLALPALQRAQRDNQRKHDLSRLAAALLEYKSNNGRHIWQGVRAAPHHERVYITEDTIDKFVSGYIKSGSSAFADPSGVDYLIIASASNPDFDPRRSYGSISIGGGWGFGRILLKGGERCENGVSIKSSDPNNFTLSLRFEASAGTSDNLTCFSY